MKVFQALVTYVTPLGETCTTTLRVVAGSLWLATGVACTRFEEEYVPNCTIIHLVLKEVT